MIPYHKTTGIIIKSRSFSEADKHLTVFTKAFGKINAIAKGARKAKSRFGSSLEIFTESKLFLYKKETRDLYLVTQTEIVNFFPHLSKDVKKFGFSSAVTEFIYNFVPVSEKNTVLYNLLILTLHKINTVKYEEKIFLMFMVKFLSLAGYKMHLSSCSSCGREVKMESGLNKRISAKYGGIVCNECGAGDERSINVLNNTVSIINFMQKKDFDALSRLLITEDTAEEVIKAVLLFLEYHFESGLKSLKILKSLLVD